ncbi:MAG: NHLP bacteriocin system secretion protein [Salinarimonas sp.]|nr:NHLP bacteriocin system secretion protein [Salinarimonas sp.]
MPKRFFRHEAIAASDRLDSLASSMRVTGSALRLAAFAFGALLIGGVVASAFIEVPIRVAGHGVLVDSSGRLLTPVLAPAQGYVQRIHVTIGDRVSPGDAMLEISLPEREVAIEDARRALDQAERMAHENARLRALDEEAQARSLAPRITSADERIVGLSQKLEWLSARVDDLTTLKAKGFTTERTLIEARIAREEAAEQLLDARAARAALDTEAEENASRREREKLADELAVERAEQALSSQVAQRDRYAVLRAPAAGRIAALDTALGALIEPGGRLVEILDIAADEAPLEAIVFVSLADGKRLAPGDRTLIAPASLPEASRDRLVARVERISETPVAPETLAQLLGNADLARSASASGPPFAVTVSFERDESGDYAWTSRGVAPAILSAGTPLSADVTVERKPLLALGLPAIERLLGMRRDEWSGARS